MRKPFHWLVTAATFVGLALPTVPFTRVVYAATSAPPTASINGTTWVQVSTPAELEYIDENPSSYLSADIELMNSIDMASSGYNWIPILGRFSGVFDGQGFAITGLTINDSSHVGVGFFMVSTGTIENLGVDATLTATLTGAATMAGILVGQQQGGSIINSYTAGSVSDAYHAGGLVGEMVGGSISDSYSTASVTSSSGGAAGGLVGDTDASNPASVTNSYAMGAVSSPSGHAGGILGSYVSGSVSVSGTYFDSQSSAASSGVGSGTTFSGITPETTSAMKMQSTYSGWDFTNTWIMPLGGGNYPVQKVFVPATPTGLQHSRVTQTGWEETWNAVSDSGAGPITYAVYLNGSQVATVTNAVYDFAGKLPGTTYQVQVASINGAGQASGLSQTDPVTTGVYPPAPPTIITQFFTESAQVGQPYSVQVREIGGLMPMHWTITQGALPPGLTMNDTGLIGGIPTTAGDYTFTVEVTDSNNLSSSKQLISTVKDQSLSLTTLPIQWMITGDPYQMDLRATGGQPPLKWSIAKGSLPDGLTLDPATGEIHGTPSSAGANQLAYQVQATDGTTVTKDIAFDVLPPNERRILWNGTTHLVPALVQREGQTPTTYMPIWYVMQFLKPMGIQSTWDGHTWSMIAPVQADLSNPQPGSGGSEILVNGALVERVDMMTAVDPSTKHDTTYIPIWYVMQLLKRVGLQSTWDGVTWSVSNTHPQ